MKNENKIRLTNKGKNFFANFKSMNMMNIKSFAIFALLCIMSTVAWGQNVSDPIGDGTNSTYNAPFNNFYKNSWNESRYDKDELSAIAGSTITAIAYNCSASSSLSFTTLKIYMGECDNASFSSTTDWTSSSDLTEVYSNSNVTVGSSTGWQTFTLDNGFAYSGNKHLVIVVSHTDDTYSSSQTWYYTEKTNAVMYRQDDNSTSYASHPGTNTGTQASYRPNIKFTYCNAPSGNFSLSQTEGTLAFGGTLNIAPFISSSLPTGGSIFYTSDNASIASVSTSGVITAGSTEGTAHITARWTHSSYCTQTVTFTANVSACGYTTKTIGTSTSTTNDYSPVNNYFNYTYTQIIYTPEEIVAGTIHSIAFQYAYTSAMTNKGNVKIYMGETDKSAFSSNSDWITSGLTAVYSGSLNCSQGWNWFSLDNPFDYSGIQNLVVVIDDNSGAYNSTSYVFYYSSSTGNKFIRQYSDSDNYSTETISGVTANNFSSNRPNTKFCIEGCTDPNFSLLSTSGSITLGGTVNIVNLLQNTHGATPTYTSSNPDVASVSSAGVVTCVSGGTATITVTLPATTIGDTKYCAATATYNITVTCTEPTLSLSSTSGSAYIGDNVTLTLTNPNGTNVTWSSSNESIATVSGSNTGATIHATGVGSATITASIPTSGAYCAKEVTYTISVTPGIASVPYTCDFENTTENNNWVLTKATDGWYIGSAAASSPSKSLYVSNDNGVSNSYSATSQYIYAYRYINFANAGKYNVSYKWECYGESSVDYMRVFLVPQSINPTLTAGTSNSISTTYTPTGWIAVDGNTYLNQHSSWTDASFEVEIPAGETGVYYLVFYWRTDTSVSNNPSATVDDIVIKPLWNITLVDGEGGTTSGSTTAIDGSSVTVTATAGYCHNFANWTENGTVVSTDASYTFTATADRTLTANFTAIEDISAGISGSSLICKGDQVTLTASGNGTYSWSNGQSSTTISATPETTTTYILTVTGNVCTGTAEHTVEVDEVQFTMTTNPADIACIAPESEVTLTAEYSYTFEHINRTFASISGSPTGTATATGDDATYSFSLPFDFVMQGTTFNSGTTIYMRCDGFASFGTSYSTHSPTSPGTTYSVISPFGFDQDLSSGTSHMYYKVEGSEGSRILTMEWYNMKKYNYSSYANYQIKLYEGSNNIEFCYGSYSYSSSSSSYTYFSTGGKIVNVTSSYTSPVITTNESGSTSSISVSSSATAPANGTVYSFAPQRLTYQWYADNNEIDGATSQTYTTTPTALSTTYKVVVTNEAGCYTEESKTVTIGPSLSVSTATPAICPGGEATITATSNANNYAWSTSSSNASITVTPDATSTYTVSASANGCTTTAEQTIMVESPQFTLATNPNSVICIDPETEISITAESTYKFEIANEAYSSITGTPSVSGDDTYSSAIPLGFTFNYWGVDYTSAVISTNGFLKLGNGDNSLGNDLASTLYYNYLAAFWDDLDANSTTYTTLGSSPNRIFVMQHNGYRHSYSSYTFAFQIRLYETSNIIEFHYGNGFPNLYTADASIGINNYSNGNTSFISVTPTGDGTATTSTETSNNNIGATQCDYLTSGTIYRFVPQDLTFQWYADNNEIDGETNTTYTTTPTAFTTIYKVVATSSTGCTSEESATVTLNPTLTVDATRTAICPGDETTITATSNATSFEWDDDNSSTTASITVAPETTRSYIVLATAENTCSSIEEITINVDAPQFSLTTEPADIACIAPETEVTMTVATAPITASEYSFEIDNENYTNIEGTTATYGDDASAPGISLGFNFNYCGTSYSTATLSTNGFLFFGSVSEYRGNDLASSSYYNYLAALWDDLYATSVHYATIGSSPNRIFVMQHDGYRLGDDSNPFSFQIRLHETSNIIEICYGSGFPDISSATASIGINSRANNVTSFISITPTGNGTATTSTTTANNSIGATDCDNLTSGTIYRFTPPSIYDYQWYANSTAIEGETSTTYSATPTALSTTYSVIATNAAGCTAEKPATVTLTPTITAVSADPADALCGGYPTTLTATSNATEYHWNNGAGNGATVTAQPEASTTYTVTASVNGCTATGDVSVEVVPSPVLTITPALSEQCMDGETEIEITANSEVHLLSIFEDNFENNFGNWISESNNADYQWSRQAGTGSTSYTSAYDGSSYDAGVFYNGRASTYAYLQLDKDLSSYTDIKLSFYYINPAWSSDIDYLYVQSSSNGLDYTNVSSYTSSHTSWTAVNEITIPEGTKYIRFAAYGNYGYGVAIDNVSLSYSYITSNPLSWSNTGTSGVISGENNEIYTVTPADAINTFTVTDETTGCTRTATVDVLNSSFITVAGENNGTVTATCGEDLLLSAGGFSEAVTYTWYNNPDLAAEHEVSPTIVSDMSTTDATYYVKAEVKYLGEGYSVVGTPQTFSYTGDVQEYTIPEGVDMIKMEVWGAQGGGQPYTTNTQAGYGGHGGYSVGIMNVTGSETLYIYVGGHGETSGSGTGIGLGGWNGGGCSYTSASGDPANGGGGATDIRINGDTYYNRIIVAGGGGGGGEDGEQGGYGGGTTGGTGAGSSYTGGTQTSAGEGSGFGYGGHNPYDGGGAGGGWYGGGSREGSLTIPTSDTDGDNNGGCGGSGYVWTEATAPSAPTGYLVSSEYYLTDAATKAGNDATIPTHDGTSTMTGNEGDGFAKITLLRRNSNVCSVSKAITVTVDKPEVSLTALSDQDVCAGSNFSQLTAQASSGSTGGTLSYEWTKDSESTILSTSAAYTPSQPGTYNVSVTSTLGTCSISTSSSADMSYKVPTAEDLGVSSIANGTVIWTGLGTNWTTTNNWMTYNNGVCSLTTAPNSDAANVIVGTYGDCVSNTTLYFNTASVSVNDLTIAEGITLTNTATQVPTLNIYGNLTNNGTLNILGSTSGVVIAGNSTTIGGSGTTSINNLAINTGKTLIGNANFNVTGNWANNGTFTAQSGTVTFNGTSAQTIGGTAATTFGNVTFNNANGITIAEEPTVAGTATFTNGLVNGDMTFAAGATTTGASVNSFVLGIVTKNGPGTSFTFPTGAKSSDDSNAMNVLGTATASISSGATVSVKFNSAATKETGDHRGYGFTEEDGFPRFWNSNDMCVEGNAEGAAPFSSVSNYEYWTIETTEALGDLVLRSEASGTDAWKAHFKEEPTTDASTYAGSIALAMRGDCGWVNGGGTAYISDDFNTIQVTVDYPGPAENHAKTTRAGGPITGFGTINGDYPLPIELVSFTAECDGNAALVSWTTATERNNEYFVLERSADAQNFNELARIAGAGNSLEPIDYSYTDYDMYGGDNYYRLIQVDYDGTSTASQIITVNCKESAGEPSVEAYPNPFYGDITVRIENFNNKPTQIEVFDILGKLIAVEKVDAPQNYYETTLNLQNLAPATYSIRVASDETVIVKKVVKQ